jgi:hypothetical protein
MGRRKGRQRRVKEGKEGNEEREKRKKEGPGTEETQKVSSKEVIAICCLTPPVCFANPYG